MEDVSKSPALSTLFSRAHELLMKKFGHREFLPGQEESLKSIFLNRSLLTVMPTGSGKSLLYQLPALLDDGLTIVVSPLISLMKDQVDELSHKGIPATCINSSLAPAEQRSRLELCKSGNYKLLYVAPERFRNSSFMEMIGSVNVSRMAVDEAHCISEWGHDFRPDYLRLRRFREQLGRPLIIALTATATPQVQKDIVESLGLDHSEVDVHVHGFDRPNLFLEVLHLSSEEEKNGYLFDFISSVEGPGIVYTGTRRTADEAGELLRMAEPSTVVYHAGMQPEERSESQARFLDGRARLAVATSAFGMGIDKTDIRFVIHYHYPGSVEQYYQEIGRAGRDGRNSRCILLYSHSDRFLREFFIDLNYPDPEIVEAVYRTLWSIPENPVMKTYRRLCELCKTDIKEGQVGAAVRLLDSAGVTRAFSGDPRIGITLKKSGPETIAGVKGKNRRRVLEALATTADLASPGRYEAGLYQLARSSGLSEDKVRDALHRLSRAGHIEYEPPFRGRGIEKLTDKPPPFHELEIDWKKQQALREEEFEKIEAMEAYVLKADCRRKYILHYFGEKDAGHCGGCDICRSGKNAPQAPQDVVTATPHIALPVLACISSLRFPLGKKKAAEVVTGSKNKKVREWKLDQNPFYNSVNKSQNEVAKVIDRLLEEKYLKKNKDRDMPTLSLTNKGKRTAEKVRPEDFPCKESNSDKDPKSDESAEKPLSSLAGISEQADLALHELIQTDPDTAKQMLENLACFHPRLLASRLESIFLKSRKSREKARAVWAAGELCSFYGFEFLLRCAESEDHNIRRLSASALGKSVKAAKKDTADTPEMMERVRETLTELSRDPAVQVSQYAQKSLAWCRPAFSKQEPS